MGGSGLSAMGDCSGQGGGGGGSTPQPTRTRVPLCEALGTAEQLRKGEKVWVILADVIARIRLFGPWTVSDRGPRSLKGLASSEHPGSEILVLCRDGVVCLQRTDGTGQLSFDEDEMLTGEFVEPANDPKRELCHNDIVRVAR